MGADLQLETGLVVVGAGTGAGARNHGRKSLIRIPSSTIVARTVHSGPRGG